MNGSVPPFYVLRSSGEKTKRKIHGRDDLQHPAASLIKLIKYVPNSLRHGNFHRSLPNFQDVAPAEPFSVLIPYTAAEIGPRFTLRLTMATRRWWSCYWRMALTPTPQKAWMASALAYLSSSCENGRCFWLEDMQVATPCESVGFGSKSMFFSLC